MGPARAFALAILAACLLTACGGGKGNATSGSIPPGHEGVAVIESWVQSLSKGDVGSAAGYFAVPSVVENGGPPLRLRSHADAVAFNGSLPCGAKLVKASPVAGQDGDDEPAGLVHRQHPRVRLLGCQAGGDEADDGPGGEEEDQLL